MQSGTSALPCEAMNVQCLVTLKCVNEIIDLLFKSQLKLVLYWTDYIESCFYIFVLLVYTMGQITRNT